MASFEEQKLTTADDNDSNDEYDAQQSSLDSAKSSLENDGVPIYVDNDGDVIRRTPAETDDDFITQIITAKDNSTLNPWTFRTWFVGIGLSIFGAALGTMSFYKPVSSGVSSIFLGVISYILGEGLSQILPSQGNLGRILNPHPFNCKEHAAILIMASTAKSAPIAIEVLTIERLYYKRMIPPLISILCILSSQFVGYGVAGVLRKTLIYPSKMLYPIAFPLVTLIEVLNSTKSAVKKKLQLFWISFIILFIWEPFPQYIMPILTGISIFCLADRNSLLFTNIFGGSNANEGIGILSLCLDMQYVTTHGLWVPFPTQLNLFIGYIISILLVCGVYYGNVWNSSNFPFMGQALFTENSTATKFIQFNQTAILNKDYVVDDALLSKQGLPFFTGASVISLITSNMAITATFTHLFLFNYNDIKKAWTFLSNNKSFVQFPGRNYFSWKKHLDTRPTDTTDPHVRLMMRYKDVPDWWYGATFILAIVFALIICHSANTSLPWWGLIISIIFAANNILFFGAQYALTAWSVNSQTLTQMIGAFIFPGRPITNMYFTLFGYNPVRQGLLLLRDLKIAQYAHLSPRCAFTMVTTGTITGAIVSYIVMNSILSSLGDLFLNLEGTNIWSGQLLQQINSQAVAYGGLANKLFSPGARYEWVNYAFIVGLFLPVPFYLLKKRWRRWNIINTSLICGNLGALNSGINSRMLGFFVSGFISQFWLRKYRPVWFKKYNYILSAGLDGGCEVMVFILTFTLLGGAGAPIAFPKYWGNNADGNFDLCMKNPAL